MAWLGLGLFYGGVITGVPVVTGVAEGVHHQKEQNKEAAQQDRMVKSYIDCFCEANGSKAKEIDGLMVVLHKDKVALWPKNEEGLPKPLAPDKPPPHPFTGFYIMYPDEERNPRERGMVSTISDDPPMLNWLYVDKKTLELRYGNRTQSIEHIVGTWDWTEDETGVTLDGWEGFVAVELTEEESKAADGLKWVLYYDMGDDQLGKGKMVGGRKVLQVSLERRPLPEELRKAQEEAANNKMNVKQSGGMSTKFEEPSGAPRKKKTSTMKS